MSYATTILDVAEERMRRYGYNAVSYRDIAAEIGIKSASLHYHFPKKLDLGVALVRRYTLAFMEQLAAVPFDATPREKIEVFVEIFHSAMAEQQLVCLCAVLGAEAPGLPPPVRAELKSFFKASTEWMETCYKTLGHETPTEQATTALALLQGAMIMSSVTDDMSALDAAAETILRDVAAR